MIIGCGFCKLELESDVNSSSLYKNTEKYKIHEIILFLVLMENDVVGWNSWNKFEIMTDKWKCQVATSIW